MWYAVADKFGVPRVDVSPTGLRYPYHADIWRQQNPLFLIPQYGSQLGLQLVRARVLVPLPHSCLHSCVIALINILYILYMFYNIDCYNEYSCPGKKGSALPVEGVSLLLHCQ